MLKRIEFIKNQTVNKKSTTALTILCSVALLTGVAMANQQGLATPTAKVDEATPVFRVEPQYPIAAARDNIEGSVILQFDIDQDGATANIKIIKAQPQQVFDKVSIIALEQWKYKPRVVAGQAQVQNNILVQLDYLLGDGPDSIQPLIEGIKVQKESM